MSLNDKHSEILAELEPFDDPQDRFQYIIDRAKALSSFSEEERSAEYLVEGCTSQLWLICTFEADACRVRVDADAVITKGIASLIADYFDGATPQEVLEGDANFLASVGIDQHLSPNRRNGLSNLVKKIKLFAQSCL